MLSILNLKVLVTEKHACLKCVLVTYFKILLIDVQRNPQNICLKRFGNS